LLYATLQRWGIGARGSRLLTLREFSASLRDCEQQIVEFESLRIDDIALDVAGTSRRLMELIKRLRLVDNKASLVPCTKALHHLLPDLVVPVDREYTQRFFGWHNPEFQSGQDRCYVQAFAAFAEIAQVTSPAQYVRVDSWHTCTAKVIDNAIVSLLVLATELGRDGAG